MNIAIEILPIKDLGTLLERNADKLMQGDSKYLLLDYLCNSSGLTEEEIKERREQRLREK